MPCEICGARPVRVVNGRTIALPVGPTIPGCGHTVCHGCLIEWAESQITKCRSQAKLVIKCCGPDCCRPIPVGLWDLLCWQSGHLNEFDKENKLKIKALEHGASSTCLIWAACPSDPGPMCTVCCTRQLALIKNTNCDHAICAECWITGVEGQLPLCEAEFRLQPPCLGSNCGKPIAWDTLHYLSGRSEAVSTFVKGREAEILRLRPCSNDFLGNRSQIMAWAAVPCHSGPVCCICNTRRLALLENPECNHAACEDCWAKWAEEQLPQCRGARDRIVRCIGPTCNELAARPVWNHVCSCSQMVDAVDVVLKKRERLQHNPLYPAPVQVECPRAECLGLGYLGFDMVMCFVCEHQWSVDEGEPPATGIGEELMGGELMKRCPSCNEHIIKNGGCDHMTCRCKYEFYWSTLKPYRTQS